MANYLSAIIIFGLDVTCFANHRLELYRMTLELYSPLSVKLSKIIDITLLKNIAEQCDFTYMDQIFKAVYLLNFFSFLRLSNFVPYCAGDFLPLKLLAKGNIIFKPQKFGVLIRLSKTMQRNNQIKLISVASLSKSPLCPVRAILNALAFNPKWFNLYLFQIKSESGWAPLTDTRARRHLILSRLNLSGVDYTFLALTIMSICKIFKNMPPGYRTVC